MNPFDENSSQPQAQPPSDSSPETPRPQSQEPESQDNESLDEVASRIVVHPALPGEEPSSMSPSPLSEPPVPPRPVDPFPVSWSTWPFWGAWLHFGLFIVFIFGVMLAVQVGLAVYSVARQINPEQFVKQLAANPGLTVVVNVALFLLVFLFLYVTLGLLQRLPFWQTLGWRKFRDVNPDIPTSRWVSFAFFGGGIVLAITVAFVNAMIKTPEHLPIQELFKNRTGAILLVSMAVFIAPLVEETVFRGYLYPLFASTWARIARTFGAAVDDAARTGTRIGILVTGVLFGLLHGAQLGWTWPLVAVLSAVGIIFTYARARAGSVYASYLLHLGYNSSLAISAIIATRGFTKMPPTP